MEKVSITHMNNAHSDWLRSLDFYKQEIGILKERLTDIAGKNTRKEVLKQVEHYENQFKVQTDNIDRLDHDINTNIASAAYQAKASSAGYIDGTLLTQHNNLGNRYHTIEKIFNEVRQGFSKFAAAWM